jgi:hypothetical protein
MTSLDVFDPATDQQIVPIGQIQQLAYFKWLAAGQPEGDRKAFWLAAEQELRQRAVTTDAARISGVKRRSWKRYLLIGLGGVVALIIIWFLMVGLILYHALRAEALYYKDALEGMENKRIEMDKKLWKKADNGTLSSEEETKLIKYYSRKASRWAMDFRNDFAGIFTILAILVLVVSLCIPWRFRHWEVDRINRLELVVLGIWTVGIPLLMLFEWLFFYIPGYVEVERFKYSLELQSKCWLAVIGVLGYVYFKQQSPTTSVPKVFGLPFKVGETEF